MEVIKIDEDQNIEFKNGLIDDVKLEIISFLNTNDGKIYVGLNNDGSINEDFINESRDENDKKLANWIQDVIYPISSDLVKWEFDDRGVMIITIKAGDNRPYFLKEKGPRPSGVYKRVGSTKRQCAEDEILRMIMTSNSYRYEDDISEEQELTFNRAKIYFEDNGKDFDERSFVSLGIINKEGKFTNLGYLLSDQSSIVVKLAEYDKDLNFKLKKEFKGSLIKIFFDVRDQIERMNDSSFKIDTKTFTRIEKKSYPDIAIRETIANAFCHADYFIRSNIKIEFYKDRIEICNPGGVYNATLEEVMRGRQTYRNPRLVHIFDKLGIIENYGKGLPRIKESYNEFDMKPIFESTTNFFTVTLFNMNEKKEVNDNLEKDNNSDEITYSINDLGLAILKLLNEKPGLRAPEIQKFLQENNDKTITYEMVRNELKRNIAKYLKYEGSKKTGGYYIVEKYRKKL